MSVSRRVDEWASVSRFLFCVCCVSLPLSLIDLIRPSSMFSLRCWMRTGACAANAHVVAATATSVMRTPVAIAAAAAAAAHPHRALHSARTHLLLSTHAAHAHTHAAPAAPAAASGASARHGLGGDGASFSSLPLSGVTARVLRDDFRYDLMSATQAQCIPVALAGRDIVARAKTGTGKTLAFLVPAVEAVAKAKRAAAASGGGEKAIRALVISPTRELAQQIEEEARRLAGAHGLHVTCAVGGLSISRDKAALARGTDLLIATPGRLLALLQEAPTVAAQLRGLKQLVLDEADRLLDMGFKRDLDAILARLPAPAHRQTQLFSATFPPQIETLAARTLRPDYALLSTVNDNASEEATHQHVVQQSLVVPLREQLHALYELIAAHKAAHPAHHKIIVFFTTAKMTAFASRLFAQCQCPNFELHSRLSQAKRSRTSDEFRAAKHGVLFSSDVSARGLDFPGISLVIQVGLTDADQYVHRLGRTARAGREGHGIILLAPFEQKLLRTLTTAKRLPVTPLVPEPNSVLASLAAGHPPSPDAKHPLSAALARVNGGDLQEQAEHAYRAFLGF